MEPLAGGEELALLRVLDRYDGSATVTELARALGVSRQKVTALAAGMKKSMWVRVSCALPGQVTYEVAPEGRRELTGGAARGGAGPGGADDQAVRVREVRMSEVWPGDEVVISGTGEHGIVVGRDDEPQVTIALEGGGEVTVDLSWVRPAGQEAP
jgi:hypothetical protein